MGVADDLPDPSVGLGETDHRQGVVLVALRNVDGDIFIKPVVAPDDVGHPAEGLQDGIAVLAHQKFMELLGCVGGGAIVVILGPGYPPKEESQGKEKATVFHLRLSSELCGKEPASP